MRAPFIKLIRVANPAAGAEFAMPARGGEWWRVLTLTFTLTTDATVADRRVTLFADDGSDNFWAIASPATHAASTAQRYAMSHGYGQGQANGGIVSIPLPGEGLWLQSGWRLRTVTDQLQVADQFSGFIALVQEFHTGPDADIHAPILGRAYMKG